MHIPIHACIDIYVLLPVKKWNTCIYCSYGKSVAVGIWGVGYTSFLLKVYIYIHVN